MKIRKEGTILSVLLEEETEKQAPVDVIIRSGAPDGDTNTTNYSNYLLHPSNHTTNIPPTSHSHSHSLSHHTPFHPKCHPQKKKRKKTTCQ